MDATVGTPRVRVRPTTLTIAAPITEVETVAPSIPTATSVRVRPGSMTIPSRWPEGSSVFWQGSSSRLGDGTDEQRPGFLGRIVKTPSNMFRAWKWRPAGYVFFGDYAQFYLACEKLG